MATNNIEEMILKSTCFGIAFDSSVRECKICEVKTRCENKCRCAASSENPQKKPTSAPIAEEDEVSLNDEAMAKSRAKEAKKALKEKKTVSAEYSEEMPDFKPMSVEELEKLLADRGGNIEDFAKYSNPSIKKMRLTMALKKTYEVK